MFFADGVDGHGVNHATMCLMLPNDLDFLFLRCSCKTFPDKLGAPKLIPPSYPKTAETEFHFATPNLQPTCNASDPQPFRQVC